MNWFLVSCFAQPIGSPGTPKCNKRLRDFDLKMTHCRKGRLEVEHKFLKSLKLQLKLQFAITMSTPGGVTFSKGEGSFCSGLLGWRRYKMFR